MGWVAPDSARAVAWVVGQGVVGRIDCSGRVGDDGLGDEGKEGETAGRGEGSWHGVAVVAGGGRWGSGEEGK